MNEAVVLAGGAGARLRSVISDVPKPMAPIRGRPFLEYLLNYWIEQGIRKFVLAIGYKHETIRKHFGDFYHSAKIDYAIEKDFLGTGGGLLLASRLISGSDFLCVNGDTFFDVSLEKMSRAHFAFRSDWTIAIREVNESNRYGTIQQDSEGRIAFFGSNALCSNRPLINGGVYLINKTVLQPFHFINTHSKISIESQMIPSILIQKKRCYGFQSKGRFIDIGIPKDYRLAESLLMSRA